MVMIVLPKFLASRFSSCSVLTGRVPQWVEIESIGNEALFLDTNQSMCISAPYFPGCHPDSIYFTDDCVDGECHKPKGPHDMGIFNLENRSMETHYCLDRSQKHMPPSNLDLALYGVNRCFQFCSFKLYLVILNVSPEHLL